MNYSDMDNHYLEWEIRHERNKLALADDIFALKWAMIFLSLTFIAVVSIGFL